MKKSVKHQYNPQILEVILGSIADGVFTVDRDFKITTFNRAAEEITGVPADEALGKYCYEVFKADICESDCALHQAMDSDQPVMRYPISIIRADGKKVSVSITASALRDRNGSMSGGVETFHDLSLIEELRRKVRGVYSFEGIVSSNKRMAEIFAILPRIAKSDSTVRRFHAVRPANAVSYVCNQGVFDRTDAPFVYWCIAPCVVREL